MAFEQRAGLAEELQGLGVGHGFAELRMRARRRVISFVGAGELGEDAEVFERGGVALHLDAGGDHHVVRMVDPPRGPGVECPDLPRRRPMQAKAPPPALKDAKLLRDHAYVDGAWAKADSGKTFPVTNPATGQTIAEVQDLGSKETRAAIEAGLGVLSAFGPEHAATIARDGYSKRDVKQFIYEHGRVRLVVAETDTDARADHEGARADGRAREVRGARAVPAE